MTPPEPDATLHAFYRRVRPHGRRLGADCGRVGCPPASGSLGRRAAERVPRLRARLRGALRRRAKLSAAQRRDRDRLCSSCPRLAALRHRAKPRPRRKLPRVGQRPAFDVITVRTGRAACGGWIGVTPPPPNVPTPPLLRPPGRWDRITVRVLPADRRLDGAGPAGRAVRADRRGPLAVSCEPGAPPAPAACCC